MSERVDNELKRNPPAGLCCAVIPVGIATAVAMWTVGYLVRLPFISGPPELLFFLLVALLLIGGRFAASRHLDRIRAGIVCGVVVAILDLLVLGSVVVPEGDPMTTTTWLSLGLSFLSFIVICTGLSVLGAYSRAAASSNRQQGIELMARTAFTATLVLVGIGGLVTSEEAGMAVPDWPSSFGNNMFLLPLSRMTGAIYYEHAHRLYGALVGLVTVSLAIYLWRRGGSRLLTILGLVAVLQVIFQGILGGLRVTEVDSAKVVDGRVTEWGESSLSLILRVVHGIDGQFFLALLAVIVTLTAANWRNVPTGNGDRIDRWSSVVLALLLTIQLIMGALSRHISRDWVVPHILGAFLLLAVVVLIGVRGGLPMMSSTRSRIGLLLVISAILQIALGFATLAVSGAQVRIQSSGLAETLVATSHQTLGAVILSLTGALICWTFKPVR
ncbi:MAG: hypothetical protein CMJ95_05110 [Planctomycetes bacterium]|nr:hypothetical protein [Planctomycetota bacterium]